MNKFTATIEQGTQEWFEMRRGKITGSVMDVVINGSVGAKNTLLDKLRFEIDNPDTPIEIPETTAPALLHGKNLEDEAVAQYEWLNDADVDRPAFLQHNTIEYLGCSPDFLRLDFGSELKVIVGEVKCPYNPDVHEANVLYQAGVQTYKAQIQTELECTGADVCHFISYCPKYADPHKRYMQIDVYRDEQYIENMLKKCELFYQKLYNNERFEHLITSDEIPSLF